MILSNGTVVISKAGRDKGQIFVVVNILDKDYVELADGKLRKIEKPKRKKIKHIIVTRFALIELRAKLDKKYKIFNKEIRKSLEVSQRNLYNSYE